MSKWVKNTGTKPNTQGKPFEVRLRTEKIYHSDVQKEFKQSFDWSFEDIPISGDILEWRFVEPVKASGLTQAEVQSLLNVVRELLDTTTDAKEFFKNYSSFYWTQCDKTDPLTEACFDTYSYHRKKAITAKQKEKKLTALITKLKGLR